MNHFEIRRDKKFRHLSKLMGGVLGVASLGVVGYWLYAHRQELEQFIWRKGNWWILLAVFSLYPVSLALIFGIWHRYIRTIDNSISFFRNLELYSYSNLVRRLPSGLGYVGMRMLTFKREGLPARLILLFSVIEMTMQLLAGWIIVALLVPSLLVHRPAAWIGILLLLPTVIFLLRPQWLARLVQKIKGVDLNNPILFTTRQMLGWLTWYGLAWLNGGIMLFLLCRDMGEFAPINTAAIVGSWTLSGMVGMIGSLVPGGQLAREATLSVLLSQYMPLTMAVGATLTFRLILTLGDVFWNTLVWIVAWSMGKKWLALDQR